MGGGVYPATVVLEDIHHPTAALCPVGGTSYLTKMATPNDLVVLIVVQITHGLNGLGIQPAFTVLTD